MRGPREQLPAIRDQPLISLLQPLVRDGPALLWCYNRAMEIVNFPQQQYNCIGASGVCPHCSVVSLLNPLGPSYSERDDRTGQTLLASIAQCRACKGFALAVGRRAAPNTPWALVDVYPMGKPDERVDEAVPPRIRADFAEALRCHWANAHKAAVAMCRRAIQVSALDKGASPGKRLVEQIDELADRGVITQPLRDMAHRVRLAGNVGAHPDEDGLKDVAKQDAADIIEFTREYFSNVYVMPAKLEAWRERDGALVQAQPAAETGR